MSLSFFSLISALFQKESELKTVRNELIHRVSEPTLHSLLGELLAMNIISDEENESVRGKILRADKAQTLINMVLRKGNKESFKMIDILHQLDPNLSELLKNYQQKEAQVRKIDEEIQKDREKRRKEEEQELKAGFEKELKESQREIEIHKQHISDTGHQTTKLQRQMSEEMDEDKKRELEQKVRVQSERREEMERKLEKREEKIRDRQAMHRKQVYELSEIYKDEARLEAERHMKMLYSLILADYKRISKRYVWSWTEENVILPCHLSPETSTASMTIRWFKGTECIYLYKNGQVIEGRSYENRLALDTQELQKGNVSLTLKDYKETDAGVYICQVQHGEQMEETAVELITNALKRNDEEIRIMVVGKRGVGKSASGNTILGNTVFKSRALNTSVTDKSEKATGVVAGRKVSVIDTPDFFDTKLNEEFKKCFDYAAPGPHAFLVVSKPWDCTENERRIVDIIQETFGKDSINYTMILFTHHDTIIEEETEFWEFLENPDVSQLINKCSNRYHLLNNKTQDPSQVTELLKKINKMVAENGRSHYTTEMFQKADKAMNEKENILQWREEYYLCTEKEDNERATSAHQLEKRKLENDVEVLKVRLEKTESEMEKMKTERDRKLEGPPETKRKKSGSGPAGSNIVTEKQLMEVAKNTGKAWKKIGTMLGIKDLKIQQIGEDHPKDHVEQVFQMLLFWKKCQGENATTAYLHSKLTELDPDLVPDNIDFLLKED